MATLTLREEATDLLQRLIRLDTVNPPGNETIAAELLRDYLVESGVDAELYAKVPERANLVARIPGRGDGPRLLLLSHTDTVVADPAEWQLDPWSGELRDGEVWGRGALDMKGQVAANAVAIASLARESFEPVNPRQPNVQQHAAERAPLAGAQSVLAARDSLDREALVFEHAAQRLAYAALVVNDEDGR